MELILLGADGRVLWAWRGRGTPIAKLGKLLWCGAAKDRHRELKSAVGLALLGEQASVSVTLDDPPKPDTASILRPTQKAPRSVSHITLMPAPPGVAILAIAQHADERIERLTRRETQILAKIPHMTRKQIARRLSLSPSTIDTVLSRVGRKLGLQGPQFIEWCYAHERILAARAGA